MNTGIFEAICSVMADVSAITKDKQNRQQGFNFRGIDDVYNSIHPLFAKHGIFTTTNVVSERTEERKTSKGGNLIYRILTIKYTFFAKDGSSVEETVIGEGMDTGDKAANKAMAIAHKYALLQLLCIPTEDMIDPDSEVQPQSVPNTDPFFTKQDYANLEQEATGRGLKQFLAQAIKNLGYERVSQIKLSQRGAILNECARLYDMANNGGNYEQ